MEVGSVGKGSSQGVNTFYTHATMVRAIISSHHFIVTYLKCIQNSLLVYMRCFYIIIDLSWTIISYQYLLTNFWKPSEVCALPTYNISENITSWYEKRWNILLMLVFLFLSSVDVSSWLTGLILRGLCYRPHLPQTKPWLLCNVLKIHSILKTLRYCQQTLQIPEYLLPR